MQRTVMRQQAWDFDRVGGVRGTAKNVSKVLPEDMSRRMSGVQVARALGKYNLYACQGSRDESCLPDLPDSICSDLKLAFLAFCLSPQELQRYPLKGNSLTSPPGTTSEELGMVACLSLAQLTARSADADRVAEEGSMLPWERVSHALMYAGIMGAQVEQQGRRLITQEQFIQLGHEATMMKLSPSVVDRMKSIFQQYDVDNSGTIDPMELAQILSSAFAHDITHEELKNLGDEWMSGLDGMDYGRFLAIIARLARIHEPDWQLLVAFRDIMGDEDNVVNGSLNVGQLRSCTHDLTEQQLAEMLWAADWRRQGTGDNLEFCDALTAVLHPLVCVAGGPGEIKEAWGVDTKGVTQGTIAPLAPRPLSLATTGEPSTKPPPGKDETLASQSRGEEDDADAKVSSKPLGCRGQLHLLLEEPSSSRPAEVLFILMGILIMLSVFTMVVQPLMTPPGKEMTKVEEDVWYGLELSFTAIFTAEYILRLFVCNALGTQTILKFLMAPSNICDVVAILPFYIELLVPANGEGFRLLRIVRLLRLTRITRIAKLAKRNPLFGPIAMVMVVIWFIYLTTAY